MALLVFSLVKVYLVNFIKKKSCFPEIRYQKLSQHIVHVKKLLDFAMSPISLVL